MDNMIVTNRSIDVALCKPHPMNYNRHDEAQIADLRASLRRFGQVRSIVVQEDGAGGFLLVAGHGLHQAARLEGLTELRADVIPPEWPPVKVVAYLAADNELARRGAPDEAQLAALLVRVQEEADEELARLAAGSAQELERLLAAQAEAEDPLAGLDPGEERYQEQYGVIVICQDEEHQESVYEELTGLGFECKVVVT